jgi:serine protease AprX
MRVVVHFMGDERRALARDVLIDPYVTDGFAVGDTDQRGIEALRRAGMAVDIVETDADREARTTAMLVAFAVGKAQEWIVPRLEDAVRRGSRAAGPWSRTLAGLPLRRVADWIAARIDRDFEFPSPYRDAPDFWVITLTGPLLAPWREELEDLDVRLLARVGPTAWTARLEPGQELMVGALASVLDVRRYTVAETLAEMQEDAVDAAEDWELIPHRAEDADTLLDRLRELGVEASFVDRRIVRVPKHALSGDLLSRVAAIPEVASLYEHRRPTLSADRAAALVGALPTLPGRDGADELVAIADTGVDQAHPALVGRDVQAKAWGREGDTSDPHGHGTHIAATVAAVAPGAGIYFQSLLPIGEIENHLPALLQDAFDAGARIHSDSWNVPDSRATYRELSRCLDGFVHKHPDMLVVVSAGNSASAPNGKAELGSIDVPGTAKNCLSVGASCGDRVVIGVAEQTWGMRDPERFKGELAGWPVTGRPEWMAAMSGRGPCEVARMKPDVVAPGTFVRAARSAASAHTDPPMHAWWLIDRDDPQYAFDGGTSMATAVASGCAAIVRRYLVVERDHEPSAALVKAILINGAHWLQGDDALEDWHLAPNYHQGFGRLSLPTTLPGEHDPILRLEFSDDWRETDPIVFNQEKWAKQFTFSMDAGSERPLRVCLAWTENGVPGTQSELKLQMTHQGSPTTWFGNADRPPLPGSRSDSDRANNVHVIRIAKPLEGTYRLALSAPVVTSPPQRFALAVSGALRSQLTLLEKPF